MGDYGQAARAHKVHFFFVYCLWVLGFATLSSKDVLALYQAKTSSISAPCQLDISGIGQSSLPRSV